MSEAILRGETFITSECFTGWLSLMVGEVSLTLFVMLFPALRGRLFLLAGLFSVWVASLFLRSLNLIAVSELGLIFGYVQQLSKYLSRSGLAVAHKCFYRFLYFRDFRSDFRKYKKFLYHRISRIIYNIFSFYQRVFRTLSNIWNDKFFFVHFSKCTFVLECYLLGL